MNHTFISIELTISLIICVCCLLIHFSQHFRLQCCNRHYTKPEIQIRQSITKLTNKFSNTLAAPNTITGNTPGDTPTFAPRRSSIFSRETLKHPEDSIQWCLRPIENEEFDFFPRSFLWYQLFLVCLLILIISRFIQLMTNNQLINNINLNRNDIMNRLTFHKSNTNMNALDWIIIYGILLLINWECLFAYYRYYSTLYSAKCFVSIDIMVIFKLFARYCIVFIILFIAQIHLYFWIFPLLIVGISCLVLFCTWKTSQILIAQCKQMELMMENFGSSNNIQHSMLKSIYFMRNSSIIGCVCCIIYLSLFLIFYNIKIIFYLPIVWSIITIAYTLNFIRNRQFLSNIFNKLFAPKQLDLKSVKSGSNFNIEVSNIQNNAQLSPTIDNNDINETPQPTTNEPKNYKLHIDNEHEIKIENNRPYTIKHNENITLSLDTLDTVTQDTCPKHEQNPSKTITLTKTAIINSLAHLEQKVNGPDFGLDMLYDINDEEIICDDGSNDSNDENIIIINEEIPFEFVDGESEMMSNQISPETSPINSPNISPRISNDKLQNDYFKSSNSKSNRLSTTPKTILPNSSHESKSNSKSNDVTPNVNYTAAVNRLDSTRKRKIINVRNKYKKRFIKFANKNRSKNNEDESGSNGKNTSTAFGKSQSTKTKFKEFRFNDPNYLKPNIKHRRIQSDKPKIYTIEQKSNPLPTLHSPSNSKNITEDVLPKIGLKYNYSDPVNKKHIELATKHSNHIQSSSFQIGDKGFKNLNKDVKRKSRRTLSRSRKLRLDKLPNKMQLLTDNEKKKVEQYANLHLCMSLHGFCEKNAIFQFDVVEI